MEKRAKGQVRPVPDFRKLHQKWDQRMQCVKHSKPSTVTKSFNLGRPKQENNIDDCLTTPRKGDFTGKIPTPLPKSCRQKSTTKRQVLGELATAPQVTASEKKVRPAHLQKQQGIEFVEDTAALNRILSEGNGNENKPTGVDHRQTFAAFGNKTPRNEEPVRMSIYASSRPRPVRQTEKALNVALSSGLRRATTLGVKAERVVNKTPAATPSVQRPSIYLRRETKTPHSTQFGTPSKVPKTTPSGMTAKRVPQSAKQSVPGVSVNKNVKWSDVFTPASKTLQDPLKKALFTDVLCSPETVKEEPQGSNQSTPTNSPSSLSPRLSLSEADLKKYQEIEEREKKLLQEINQLAMQGKTFSSEPKPTSPQAEVESKETIGLCAASFQKAADNFALFDKSGVRRTSGNFQGPSLISPDRQSDGFDDMKKGLSPLSDVDSAVDVGSIHNLTIDELNQSLNYSVNQFERLQSEFRSLQNGGNDTDIMRKLQQIEKQQGMVLKQQAELRKQLAEQQEQLQKQQQFMSTQKRLSPELSAAQTETPASSSRRFSTSENSPFAMYNRCQSVQKSADPGPDVRCPTSVKLSPAVIVGRSDIPFRTPLAMVENVRCGATPSSFSGLQESRCDTCVKAQCTPLQSVQSAFRSTRTVSHDSFSPNPLYSGLDMTPNVTTGTRSLRAHTILSATSRKFQNALLDEEVSLYMTGGHKSSPGERFDLCCRLLNPVAKTLMEGDDMHFIPIKEESFLTYTPEGSAFSAFVR